MIETHDIPDYLTADNIRLLDIYWKYRQRRPIDPWGGGWMNWPDWFDALVEIGDAINWPIQSREI
jgi:hypothetical protein